MRTLSFWTLLAVATCLFGCIQKSTVDQRVVELPMTNSNATIATAAQIGQGLIKSGLAADVQKKFPSLSSQQLQGLFLTWNTGNFSGTNSVFFLTGIRYTGSMPEAKSVADYLQSRVKEAVATNYSSPAGK
jgi:hypothetical protein